MAFAQDPTTTRSQAQKLLLEAEEVQPLRIEATVVRPKPPVSVGGLLLGGLFVYGLYRVLT